MSRSLSQLAKVAGQWVRDARHHFDWSEEELIDRIARLRGYFRVVRVPEIEDVESLEAGREKHIPAWVKFARLAVEHEQLDSEADRLAWAEQRSPWQDDLPHEAFDCCWPLVTRQEFMLLEDIDRMTEDQRRMAFRLAAAWNSPYAERNKVFDAAIQALAARMHVPAPPVLPGPARRLPPELTGMLYKFDGDDIAVLAAYLACDKAGRAAIAATAFREAGRDALDATAAPA